LSERGENENYKLQEKERIRTTADQKFKIRLISDKMNQEVDSRDEVVYAE